MKKFIPLLLLLVFVFIASGQTSEQQSLEAVLKEWLPNKPLESFLSLFHIPYWGFYVSVEERGYYAFVEFLIRKGVHFFYFGLISLAIYIALPKRKYRKLTAIMITFLLAVADEFHQSFTSGRSALFQDVLLDTGGAIFVMLLLTFVQWLKHRKNANL
ncbi:MULTISPECIES: VanZ family protein [Psychrobacillus]|uniref:VanZ family protein n=1 Tax=Psychrobacillus faecigallinarum TaxID=2762235 RepID=A0ABR8RCF0_9BACI|nr:VanZ family protein [Psychrobacillus faecigallinarum]MBD7945365.1 VanZ family protein [Psychrobacillus faecigallinarum]